MAIQLYRPEQDNLPVDAGLIQHAPVLTGGGAPFSQLEPHQTGPALGIGSIDGMPFYQAPHLDAPTSQALPYQETTAQQPALLWVMPHEADTEVHKVPVTATVFHFLHRIVSPLDRRIAHIHPTSAAIPARNGVEWVLAAAEHAYHNADFAHIGNTALAATTAANWRAKADAAQERAAVIPDDRIRFWTRDETATENVLFLNGKKYRELSADELGPEEASRRRAAARAGMIATLHARAEAAEARSTALASNAALLSKLHMQSELARRELDSWEGSAELDPALQVNLAWRLAPSPLPGPNTPKYPLPEALNERREQIMGAISRFQAVDGMFLTLRSQRGIWNLATSLDIVIAQGLEAGLSDRTITNSIMDTLTKAVEQETEASLPPVIVPVT